MCKLKKYHGTSNTQIDKCLRFLIENLKGYIGDDIEIVGCCCGHSKYPMTLIMKHYNLHISPDSFTIIDWCSNKEIKRTQKFYKRDEQGFYYIPEVLK